MTSITQWLDAEKGRSKALAQLLRISTGRMSQIKASGVVPKEHRQKVAEFTRGEVPLVSMLTDVERGWLRQLTPKRKEAVNV